MDTSDFYSLVDKEISVIIKEYSSNLFLVKLNTEEGRKSYGFLIWFLKKYAPYLKNVEEYITEGEDDSSCDIIFDNKDNFGVNVYYIIQAKWRSKSNSTSSNGMTKEIKYCLSDFQLVAKGKKSQSTLNSKFNVKYDELKSHLEKNGETKFVFATLGIKDHQAADHISEFESNIAPFEIIDINRLKRDFIEMEYKGAKTHNPIETPYEPKGEIEIEYIVEKKITIEQPFTSYILILKPKQIHDLFSKYGFALFYKNIRNPLHHSNFNEKIVTTLKDNPVNFWYFNNGITAISDSIKPIRTGTKAIVHGLQIINGAQTVYSIHIAYEKANANERQKMDATAILTLRLLTSGGKDFDLNVTRYTNSQNPINERDFHSNDEVQLRLQNDFFDNTNIWYERRRGEFRKKIKNIEIVTNETFGQTYLAYTLKDPVNAKNKSKWFFISDKADSNGLYERIFHPKAKYDDMLASYYLFNFIERKRKEVYYKMKRIEPKPNGNYSKEETKILQQEFVLHASFHILTAFQVLNSSNIKGFNGKVISNYKVQKMTFVETSYTNIVEEFRKKITSIQEKDPRFSITRYFKTANSMTLLKSL